MADLVYENEREYKLHGMVLKIKISKLYPMPELSRNDKQLARTIIEKGLEHEIENSIIALERIIKQWREKKVPIQDAWRQLYHSVNEHDKSISRRYDGLSGSHYDITLASQLREGAINAGDLAGLEEEMKSIIVRWSTSL
jgi:hypothetical protein